MVFILKTLLRLRAKSCKEMKLARFQKSSNTFAVTKKIGEVLCSLAYRGKCVPDPTAISEKPRSDDTIEFLAPLG